MSHRSLIQAFAAGGAVTALAACTTLPVTTDVNPAMSVASCHTYAFADEHVANSDHQAAFGNPLNAERLQLAIEYNLAAKGIQKVADRRGAECIVGYAMGTRQVIDSFYGDFGFGWGWGGGWGRRGWGGYYDGPYAYDQTRVSIDLFDAKTRVPIWHASVNQNVSDLTGPHAVERINAAAAAIFAKFPAAGVPVAGANPVASEPATT